MSQSTISFILEKVLYLESLEDRVKLIEERNLELEKNFDNLQNTLEEIQNFQKSLGQVDPIEQVNLSSISSQVDVTFIESEEVNSDEIEAPNFTKEVLKDPLKDEITMKYIDLEQDTHLESSKNQLLPDPNNLTNHPEGAEYWTSSDNDDDGEGEIDPFGEPEKFLKFEQTELENEDNSGILKKTKSPKVISIVKEKNLTIVNTIDRINSCENLDFKMLELKNCCVLLKRFETDPLLQKYVPQITKNMTNTAKPTTTSTVEPEGVSSKSKSVFLRRHEGKCFKCKICKKVLTNLSNLKRHLRSLHKTTDNFYIEDRADRRKGIFKCQQCDKSFRKLEKLTRHRDAHKKELKTPQIDDGSIDMIINHGISSPASKNFEEFNTCKFCKKNFATFVNLKKHMFTLHGGENLQEFTAFCLKREDSKAEELSQEETIEIDANPENILMESPSSNHAGGTHGNNGAKKSNTCTFCWKNFSNFANLKRHVLALHPGDNLHKCQTCPKSFADLDGLRKHFLTDHPAGDETFPCPICPKLFDSEENLNGHLNRTHYVTKGSSGQLSSTPNGQNHGQNIKCQLCQESLSKFSDLLKHTCRSVSNSSKFGAAKPVNFYKNLHNGLGTNISKKYANQALVNQKRIKKVLKNSKKSSTKAHLNPRKLLQNNKDMNRPFKCKMCKNSYTTKWNLKKHQISHEGMPKLEPSVPENTLPQPQSI